MSDQSMTVAAPAAQDIDQFVGSGNDRWAGLSALRQATDLSSCLVPLLEALDWNGHPRHVAEALPHFIDELDLTGFRNVMAQLNFSSRPVRLKLRDIDPRLMPCLFLPDRGDAVVVLDDDGHDLQIFDGGTGEYAAAQGLRNPRGTAVFFAPIEEEDTSAQKKKIGWFQTISSRFRGLIYQTLGITLILNLLALATPLFVMAVYDRVISTGSLTTLGYFSFGVGIAVVCDLVLRVIRSRILAFVGARLDKIVGTAIFEKILFLPPAFTERATVGAQVARIKDFETVREFFTGPMALVFFELPFVLVFVITIFFIGGPVAFVPLIMIACFVLISLIMAPFVRTSVAKSARASAKRQEVIIEALSEMRALKYCGAEMTWFDRYRDTAAKAALANFNSSQIASVINNLSHLLMVGSGAITMTYGVFLVFEGNLTVGGLVACMILVWRVLAPLQTAFISLSRLTQVRSSIHQINHLMTIAGERDSGATVAPIKQLQGHVSFSRVSLRYSPEAHPALVGVSFDVTPGEVIAIVGANGSGKSTVLKLIAGMYTPQAGSVRIDNMDIRQLDPIELRHAVGYVPQAAEFFYGTIAQNLRLARPTATDEELHWAASQASVLDDILAMPEGFGTRISDSSAGYLPTSLQQRLNLARGYLKQAPVLLLDEPGNGLDFESDKAFMATLERMRGQVTVFIVTHRPSHLRMADRVIWLDAGQIRGIGPPDEVMKHMPKDFL